MKTKLEQICIIDDDPIHVFGVKKIIQLSGICNSFLIYNNGLEALNKIETLVHNESFLPEVILLDLNMPVMDGWEFLKEIVKIKFNKKIHIFVVTSSVDPRDFKRAQEIEHVDNFIVKPITFDKLKNMLSFINSN